MCTDGMRYLPTSPVLHTFTTQTLHAMNVLQCQEIMHAYSVLMHVS